MDLGTFCLKRTSTANSTYRTDLATGATDKGDAVSDGHRLAQQAVALMIHIGATGTITYVDGTGETVTIDVTKRIQGAYHQVAIRQIRATGTTCPGTAIELGWTK
jgi:hypothetical protein